MEDPLCANLLRELIAYNPETGEMRWLPRPREAFKRESNFKAWNKHSAGKLAVNTPEREGYRHGDILGRTYKAHRVAWALYHGEWPADQIDHINGDKADNRIANLRVVSNAENNKNTSISKRNKTGVLGVFYDKKNNVYLASICQNAQVINLGRFQTKEEAARARKQAERDLGFHENHGRQKTA
jgi:hypothetical protein